MAKLHGRFGPKSQDRSADPGADYTTPGFRVTERGPGVERVARAEERVARLESKVADTRGRKAEAERQIAEHRRRYAELKAQLAPDLRRLRAENKIPAAVKREVVEVKPLSPEQEAAVHAERRALRVREAIRMQDPRAEKTTNASLHVVETPGGAAAYHRQRQATALEMARDLRGKDRKFALTLAREHGEAKRAAGGGAGQKRVPPGQPTGGRWTR